MKKILMLSALVGVFFVLGLNAQTTTQNPPQTTTPKVSTTTKIYKTTKHAVVKGAKVSYNAMKKVVKKIT